MMTQAFYTGLSGLISGQSAIDITANNLANINTVGYKGNSTEFASLFEVSLANVDRGSSINSTVGIGARVQATAMDLSQGNIMLTDRSTDLAIMGNGWFGIKSDGDTFYTRAGNFTFDENDDLVTPDGLHVLGTVGNNISGTTITKRLDSVDLGALNDQQKLRFPKSLSYPPEPTTTARFYANVGTDPEVRTMSAGVVDPQGNKNELKLVFTKAAVQTPPGTQWDVVATTQSLDGNTVYDTQSGRVNFDATGALTSSTLSTINNNGANVTIDLGSDFEGVVSISNSDITASSLADGTIGGDLMGYSISPKGEVIATFTNGMQSSVGRIAVYHFRNDQGLERITGTRFLPSSNSGDPFFYTDANGKNIIGTNIDNFKLENSNVRMEAALTELIIFQRTYGANSKSITVADEMIKKALTMKGG
ncbi:MAG: flagellar hook protein FlgE [Epsilonproteobacteria bacterium]|nr:flagellar hook protein FlgE [Campylobacterota bacterium]